MEYFNNLKRLKTAFANNKAFYERYNGRTFLVIQSPKKKIKNEYWNKN